MAKLVNISVPTWKVATFGCEGANGQIYRITAGILKIDIAHAASGGGLFLAAPVDIKAQRLQRTFRAIRLLGCIELQCPRVSVS
jgi:hypothetical protein